MMDKDFKIQTLKHFSSSDIDNKKANDFLSEEYAKIRTTLLNSDDYNLLHELFDYLEVIIFRVSEQACQDLLDFIHKREGANIELHDGYDQLRSYCTNANLQALAIKQLARLRYIEKCQNTVMMALFDLSTHDDETVKKEALSGLESFVHLDIPVYDKIGMQPQLQVLGYILAMKKKEVLEKQDAIFMALGQFFSPRVQNYVSHHDTIEIRSGAIPASAEIIKLRSKSLEFVKIVYSYDDSISWKRRCLSALQSAKSLNAYRAEMSPETTAMITKNAIDVLEFLKSLVPTEHPQIIQKIEKDSYWTYYHYHNTPLREKALEIEQAIDDRDDYEIYRDLVGFEGIFEDWEARRAANNRINDISDERDERRRRVLGHAQSVTLDNFDAWRGLIIEFLATESNDLATFPHMYDFLKELSKRQPALMFDFLVSDTEKLDKALIAIIIGLWETDKHEDLKSLILAWVADRRYLYVCSKIFLAVTPDEEILQALFEASGDNEEAALNILPMIIAACSEFFESGEVDTFTQYFIPSIQRLTELKHATWLHEVWFRQNMKEMLATLNEDGLNAILDNLVYADTVDYHSEAILSIIAKTMPEEVVSFFGNRLSISREPDRDHLTGRYEAIPFDLNTVDEALSKHPEICVGIVRTWFDDHESMFEYDGGRLLHNIFPKVEGDYELALLKFIQSDDEQNIDFVASLLRAYDGNDTIFNLAREIVKVLPEGHDILNTLRSAIWSSGVLRGEYGFADMLKGKADKIAEWASDENPKVKRFGEEYAADLAEEAEARRKQADEEITLRKHAYGEE